ncbi:MAG: hypothetical protein [Wendovervirus sonii]|uniref:Phosphopantetheine adenylyltransferase n=1 Tax=phage Lak_Megaphage_Sonny TaxID=3109229 RepID=A0ABZ0Z5N2_9CAUD|nr:MAG: hypothetical protein [phage Lak_Megaphage_Sonny]
MKTVEELKNGDIIYEIVPETLGNNNIFKICEREIIDISHITFIEKNFGDWWTPDIRKIDCNKYQILYADDHLNKQSIEFDIQNSTQNIYHYKNTIFFDFNDALVRQTELNQKEYLRIAEEYDANKKALSILAPLLNIEMNNTDIVNASADNKPSVKIIEKIGIFPGSFNPFTEGHKNIVENALKVFDKVIIAFGINSSKNVNTDADDLKKRIKAVKKAFEGQNVKVIQYDDMMTMDLAKKHKATIIRGIRNVIDFEYEKNIADINKIYGGIDTIFFLGDPEYRHISGTMVREFEKYGKNIENLKL